MKQSTNLEAQNTSCLVTYDDTVGYDHCGWPLYHLRVISLLRTLGINDEIIDKISEEILKQHIVVGVDGGMGYISKTLKVTDAIMTKEGLCLIY